MQILLTIYVPNFELCKTYTTLYMTEVNNRETIAAIEVNNDMYFLKIQIEKFPLRPDTGHICKHDLKIDQS